MVTIQRKNDTCYAPDLNQIDDAVSRRKEHKRQKRRQKRLARKKGSKFKNIESNFSRSYSDIIKEFNPEVCQSKENDSDNHAVPDIIKEIYPEVYRKKGNCKYYPVNIHTNKMETLIERYKQVLKVSRNNFSSLYNDMYLLKIPKNSHAARNFLMCMKNIVTTELKLLRECIKYNNYIDLDRILENVYTDKSWSNIRNYCVSPSSPLSAKKFKGEGRFLRTINDIEKRIQTYEDLEIANCVISYYLTSMRKYHELKSKCLPHVPEDSLLYYQYMCDEKEIPASSSPEYTEYSEFRTVHNISNNVSESSGFQPDFTGIFSQNSSDIFDKLALAGITATSMSGFAPHMFKDFQQQVTSYLRSQDDIDYGKKLSRALDIANKFVTVSWLLSKAESESEFFKIITFQFAASSASFMLDRASRDNKTYYAMRPWHGKKSFSAFIDLFIFRSEKSDFINTARTVLDCEMFNSFLDLAKDAVIMEIVPARFRSHFVKFIGTKPYNKIHEVSYLSLSRKILDLIGTTTTNFVNYLGGKSSFFEVMASPKDIFLNKSFKAIHEKDFYSLNEKGDELKQSIFKNIVDLREILALHSDLTPSERNEPNVSRNFSEIKRMLDKYQTTVLTMNRKVPFGIIIFGNPGVGKSSLCTAVYKIFCKHAGLEYKPSMVYDRTSKLQFWDKYSSTEHKIVHMPEVGAMKDTLAAQGKDVALDELLLVVNDAPYIANMANVDEKGCVLVCPDLVVIDTNVADLNAQHSMNNPTAVWRRFMFVHAELKEEYSDNGALDTDKAAMADNPMDLWNFQIYRRIPSTNNTYTEKYLHRDNYVNIAGLRDIMYSELDKAEEKRKNFIRATRMDPDDYGTMKSESSFFYNGKDNIDDIIDTIKKLQDELKEFEQIISDYENYPVPAFDDKEKILDYQEFKDEYLESYNFALKEVKSIKLKLNNLYDQWPAIFEDDIHYLKKSPYIYKLAAMRKNKLYKLDAFGALKKGFGQFTKKTTFMSRYYYYNLKEKIWNSAPSRLLLPKIRSLYKIYGPSGSALRAASIIGLGIMSYKMYIYWTDSNITNTNPTMESENDNLDSFHDVFNSGFGYARKRDKNVKDWSDVAHFSSRIKFSKRTKNNPDEIYNTVTSNQRTVVFVYEGQDGEEFQQKAIILGLYSNLAIFNTHYLRDDLVKLEVSNSMTERSGFVSYPADHLQFYKSHDDITFVVLKNNLFKDLRDLMCTKISDFDSALIEHHPGGNACEIFTNTVTFSHHSMDRGLYIKDLQTSKGYCGIGRVVIINKHCILAGIHSGSNGNGLTACALICKEYVREASNNLNVGLLSEGSIPIPENLSLGTVHKKSSINFEDVSSFRVYGGVSGRHRSTLRTSYIKMPWYDDLEDMIGVSAYNSSGQPKHLPPVFKPFVSNGNYKSPYNMWLRKVKHDKPFLDKKILNRIENILLKRFLTKTEDVKLAPLQIEAALNGVENDAYISRMNFSTSAGVFYDGKKKSSDYIVIAENDKAIATPFLRDKVAEVLECYRNGEMSHGVLGAYLKDEILPRYKVVDAKTRVFFGAPFPELVVQRMFLSPFYSIMIENRDVFNCKLGINMHSHEVENIVHRLKRDDRFIFEGDYSGYDVTFPMDIARTANSIVSRFLQMRGYNSYAISCVDCILEENLFPTVLFDDVIMTMPGIQPSGKYGTAEDNSLRGLILLMYGWYFLMCDEKTRVTEREFMLTDFFLHVDPIIYGDDVIASVSFEASDFNAVSYSKFCYDVFKAKFTGTDKQGEIQPFVDFENCSFLKRNFRYSNILKRWVAPLAMDSLTKMTSYLAVNKNLDNRTLAAEILHSYLTERFLHCDLPEEYDHWRERAIHYYNKYYDNVSKRISMFLPTCDELIAQMNDLNQHSGFDADGNPIMESEFIGALVRVATRAPKIAKRAVKAGKNAAKVIKSRPFKSAKESSGGFVKNLVRNTKNVLNDKPNGSLKRAKADVKQTKIQNKIKPKGTGEMIKQESNKQSNTKISTACSCGKGEITHMSSESSEEIVYESDGPSEAVVQNFDETYDANVGTVTNIPYTVSPNVNTYEEILSRYFSYGYIRAVENIYEMNPYVMFLTHPLISKLILQFGAFRADLRLSISWDASPYTSGIYYINSYPNAKNIEFFGGDYQQYLKLALCYVSQGEHSAKVKIGEVGNISYNVPFTYYHNTIDLAKPTPDLLKTAADVSTVFIVGNGIRVPANMRFFIKMKAENLVLGMRSTFRSESSDPINQTTGVDVSDVVQAQQTDEHDETGLESSEDTILEMCARETLIYLHPWRGDKDEVLACIPVTPMYGVHDTFTMLTPAGWTASSFHLWRGTMFYRVCIETSPTTKGRVSVFYTPSPKRWNTVGSIYDEMGERREFQFDLSKRREIVVQVGMSERPYYKCDWPNGDVQYKKMGNFVVERDLKSYQEDWYEQGLCNGFVTVQVIGDFLDISTEKAVQVYIHSWMEDVSFFVPRNGPHPAITYTASGRETFFSESSDIFVARAPKLDLDDSVNFSSYNYDNIYTLAGTMTAKMRVTIPGENNNEYFTMPRFLPLSRGEFTVNEMTIELGDTFHDHFRQCYAFQRGSYNYMILSNMTSQNVSVSSDYSSTWKTIYEGISSHEHGNYGFNIYNINLTQGPYEFSSSSLAGTYLEPTIYSQYVFLDYDCSYQDITFQIPNKQGRRYFTVAQSVGHDFNYMFFLGCPPIRLNPPRISKTRNVHQNNILPNPSNFTSVGAQIFNRFNTNSNNIANTATGRTEPYRNAVLRLLGQTNNRSRQAEDAFTRFVEKGNDKDDSTKPIKLGKGFRPAQIKERKKPEIREKINLNESDDEEDKSIAVNLAGKEELGFHIDPAEFTDNHVLKLPNGVLYRFGMHINNHKRKSDSMKNKGFGFIRPVHYKFWDGSDAVDFYLSRGYNDISDITADSFRLLASMEYMLNHFWPTPNQDKIEAVREYFAIPYYIEQSALTDYLFDKKHHKVYLQIISGPENFEAAVKALKKVPIPGMKKNKEARKKLINETISVLWTRMQYVSSIYRRYKLDRAND
jgi:hypothetical protein